ncbi:uncharacterized bromodomain-containing protein 10-like [Pseudorasbora parva]|uniref:uncharacterized bromodomain-containing protein 10-like n=1 Tax=Pseudorasbora parva TaxID=51549 RepID=UPI00351EB8C6
MKLHSDLSENRQVCDSASYVTQDMNLNHQLTLTSCVQKKPEFLEGSTPFCNGSSDQSELENLTPHCDKSEEDPNRFALTSDDLAPEIQQAYRIFQSFLSEKHKSITARFWHPIGPGSHSPGAEMTFRKMHDKFANREYETITAFVADFRLMLENCYRFHGVDHWISKQAQKLEIILEQKLTLLSRTLREKTSLSVTSRGRFGSEDERAPVGSSSRRRLVPRNLAAITVGGSESIMVQALRLEELQRAKDEKRQRELERKGVEEASVKDLEEWESSLLALAEPWPIRSMWELPAIGHFLCLAQTALNLPEIVFYELERCLLMPRCSSFLAKVMTSLLCPPHRRASVHRRPPLAYRKWEAELRRRVQSWYREVGRAEDQMARGELMGLSHQFFWTLGEVSPLEVTPFHLLPFPQRVWLLKGLCDHVYETQKDVQDAVLAQPIHECRESILGYDGQDNAYIHFPHFCGADLRIYRQSPSRAVEFPLPLLHVKRSQETPPEGSEVTVQTRIMKVQDESQAELRDHRCSSSVISWSRDESPDSGSIRGTFPVEGRLKEEEEEEEEDESDCEPCFRVGESCYKGVSPAQNKKDANHMTCEDQSPGGCGAAQDSPRLWADSAPLHRDHAPMGHDSTPLLRDHAHKKKAMRKTSRLSLKKRTAKRRLQRATAMKKKDKRKRWKLGNRIDGKMMERRAAGSALLPEGPSFQLICSSLDDLRVLIRKTEDQLKELNGGKPRSERRPNKRAVVKELHITLIRLLNELLPWEPKLAKAFQRNRARLKKECDDFKKHPEYENFIREPMDSTDSGEVVCSDGSLSTETTRELDEMDRTIKDDSEATENVILGNHESGCLADRPEMAMHSWESGPFTRSSKRRQSGAIGDELSPNKRGKTESSELNVEVASREQATVMPQPLSSFQGSFKPIQALLAKSVGNKVTLISHPKAAVMDQVLQDISKTSDYKTTTDSKETTTSTTESIEQVVYKTAGGVGLLRKGSTSAKFSAQSTSDQHVVILPSNILIQSAKNKAPLPKNTTYLSNASGFTIPENKVPVQQVAPLIDTSTARAPSAVVTPNLRSFVGGSAMPKKTSEPKVVVNKSASSVPTKSDAKQELRTVCIRDSQSILVTTRGGNTGVVKVQTSESGTHPNLPSSPVFTISPQLQAFLVSKSSTSSTHALSANSESGVAPQSLSKDVVPVSSYSFVAPSTLNPISNDGTQAKTSIPGKSARKNGNSVLVTAKDIQGFMQNTECGMKPQQKRTLPESRSPDQSAFQKVFLVSPSTNIPNVPKVSTATLPGSRVMFISNSTLPIPSSTPEVNISSTRVIPKLGTTLSCTSSGTNNQSLGVPGLMSRILTPTAEASMKATPVIVSRVSGMSTLFAQKSCLAPIRSPSGNSASSLKASGTVDGKTLTFSTLGTGHMASSALLSVVKPDVPSSILNAPHCKPGLITMSSCSGSLITKHTTLPVDVTTNKTPNSFCSSGSASSGVSSPPPVVKNSTIQEKIVINTNAPLAPGTQLLINNTRFVVPSQGLGPGSHVLLINSNPGGLQGPASPRGPNSSSVIQGVRLATPVRLPSPKVSGQNPGVSSDTVRLPGCPKEAPSSQVGLLSTTSPMHGRLSQNQVTMPPIKTAIARHSPMLTVPSISRMQKLPVAMVPPIGGPATPIASVPPFMNIMTPCPPIRAVNPGTIGKPAILSQSLQGQNTVPSPSKLLLSPDGAILNIVLAKPMDARVVGSSSSRVTVPTLNTNNPLRNPDTIGRPNH